MSMIHLENIEFGYKEDNPILAIDQFRVEKGEKVFLHGPSGSGKSTLLNLLAGVLNPQRGKIFINGEEINLLSATKRDQFRGDHIGFIFQRFNLINYLSISENISLPIRSSKVRKKKMKGSLIEEITRLIKHLDLENFVGQKAMNLSVGQQQRVAVARALIGNPEIIIADEPTSSLDDDVTGKFVDLLLDECKKTQTTVLFVSHDKRLASHFDREVSLNEINNKGGKHA